MFLCSNFIYDWINTFAKPLDSFSLILYYTQCATKNIQKIKQSEYIKRTHFSHWVINCKPKGICMTCCSISISDWHLKLSDNNQAKGLRDRDRMVVEFIPTYAISTYHHGCCEFESRSGRGVQHYVIRFVSDLWQIGGFLRVLRFPLPIKLTATIQLKYCWKWR
jgi:hypothetical protein